MELILEIIVYLLVVLGLITVCFTFFNRFNLIDPVLQDRTEVAIDGEPNNEYIREKKEGQKLVLNVRYKSMEQEELDKVRESIKKGAYNDIMDIADEVNYIDASKKKNKTKKG